MEQAAKIADELKSKGKSVVLTTGTYDILHVGHLRSLEESKAQGDCLFVAINSDASVRAYKSPDRPINMQDQRAELLAGLECVDYVFVFDDIEPSNVIRLVKPSVYTNSSDYGEECIERPALLEVGAKLHLLRKYEGFSTTSVLNRL